MSVLFSSLGEWSNPIITGSCIPPTSDCIIEQISNNRAILFGGLINDDTVTNTVYLMDISDTVVSYYRVQTVMFYGFCIIYSTRQKTFTFSHSTLIMQ